MSTGDEYSKPCVYCGMPSQETDHVPPKCYRKWLAGCVEFLIVASCRECNALLGKRPLYTLEARQEFIRRALRKKYHRFLSMPDWRRSELNELEGRLEQFVRNSQTTREIVEMRLSYQGTT